MQRTRGLWLFSPIGSTIAPPHRERMAADALSGDDATSGTHYDGYYAISL
jgi:hypothetical protein